MGELFLKLLPIIIIAIATFLAINIRIASENQRFALFNIGRFKQFKGPGLLIKWPWGAFYWVKLTVGDRGELINDKLMKFKDFEIPIKGEGEIPIGSRVRIKGFSEELVFVIKDTDQRRTITCEKCGHKMEI